MPQLAAGLGGMRGIDEAPLGGYLALGEAFWFDGDVDHAPFLSVWGDTQIESIWDDTRRMHTYLGIKFASCSSRARRKRLTLDLGVRDPAGAPGYGADASIIDDSIVDTEDTAAPATAPASRPATVTAPVHTVSCRPPRPRRSCPRRPRPHRPTVPGSWPY